MTEADSHARRIVEELCEAVGRPGEQKLADGLLAGEAMSVDERPVRLVREKRDPGHFHVYIDLGVPSSDPSTYERMLKINFQLAAGQHGVLSLYPRNGHALFAFRYPIDAASTGRELLKQVLGPIGDMDEGQFLSAVAAKTTVSGH
jgi:hypothetical protein